MRLTVSLEGNGEGRVLSSVDMEEIVKMTITDDIEKSNFNPQMLKVCTDTSYECGYQQGRADAIDDAIEYFIEHAHEVYDHVSARDYIGDRLEQLKEQK